MAENQKQRLINLGEEVLAQALIDLATRPDIVASTIQRFNRYTG
jgi:hypothetical protein